MSSEPATCPGEQTPHVNMYGFRDRINVTQEPAIEGEDTKCHLEGCFFGIPTTQVHKGMRRIN